MWPNFTIFLWEISTDKKIKVSVLQFQINNRKIGCNSFPEQIQSLREKKKRVSWDDQRTEELDVLMILPGQKQKHGHLRYTLHCSVIPRTLSKQIRGVEHDIQRCVVTCPKLMSGKNSVIR